MSGGCKRSQVRVFGIKLKHRRGKRDRHVNDFVTAVPRINIADNLETITANHREVAVLVGVTFTIAVRAFTYKCEHGDQRRSGSAKAKYVSFDNLH